MWLKGVELIQGDFMICIKYKRVKLGKAAREDLDWWLKFCATFNPLYFGFIPKGLCYLQGERLVSGDLGGRNSPEK